MVSRKDAFAVLDYQLTDRVWTAYRDFLNGCLAGQHDSSVAAETLIRAFADALAASLAAIDGVAVRERAMAVTFADIAKTVEWCRKAAGLSDSADQSATLQ